ncbi:alkaline phosphatase [Thamnocephalis sphaerospora]|uniref:Alkaline phosphatase n=1 Tax=Thamnocephalis sphaerospora TaxID=78915 RepID=A0A4P9XFW4_9FUNG|nr:alkaline phosphatase [Thamnocephalis sphaerospora]|eukprot:RKP04448.1 alkaline phosphatase [Thamnocephalis sphaerospora]
MMVSDGFGPASETFARSYHQYVHGLPYNYTTPLDAIHVGASRTRSSSSLVTDSAAGATAFSCALKSYNAAIGVDPDGHPCGTVLEAAKARKMYTGLVATSRITHATPAAFSAHVPHRDQESAIAVQQIGDYPLGRTVDLMFGGGACFFKPKSSQNSCRTDERDVLADARRLGWSLVQSRSEFDTLPADDATKLPVLGLFARSHMSYTIDREPTKEPSLREMAEKALSLLQTAADRDDQGFFLMIEGSRIDMAAHSNDPAAHVHDIEAYHETIAAVRSFVDAHPDTVMVSVSDHETGGFTLGRQNGPEYPEYIWHPSVIHRVQNSTEKLAATIATYDQTKREAFVRDLVIKKWLGIQDAGRSDAAYIANPKRTLNEISDRLADLVSTRAMVGWTTHGHSGVDVNLYAHGAEAEQLRGNHENTDIGDFIARFLGLDLNSITQTLTKNSTFMPAKPSKDDHQASTMADVMDFKHM